MPFPGTPFGPFQAMRDLKLEYHRGGCRADFPLFSQGIAQVSLRYPLFLGGGGGGTLRKGGGGYRTQLAMLRHQKTIACKRGYR